MMDIYKEKRHWLFALDPLHVGSGREHLTHIDLPLVREQGTGLPLIPGSSLAGVCRAYAFLQAQAQRPAPLAMVTAVGAAADPVSRAATGRLESVCAGKGGPDGDLHCGKCAICLAFGYSKKTSSRQGLAQIGSAHVVYFPIATTAGPVWITCPRQLAESPTTASIGEMEIADGQFCPNWMIGGALTFGWNSLIAGKRKALRAPIPEIVKIAVVNDANFCTLVNANLEVRTLVSINPSTGAAADSALFTYEAIPRATLLWFDVVIANPQLNPVQGEAIPYSFDDIERVTDDGFKLMRHLGLGGMNTRGLGRARITIVEPPSQ